MVRSGFTLLRHLTGDIRAVTAVEFALIAPVFFMLLLGIFNLGQMVYLQSLFHGAVQDAGRDAGLESGAANLKAIDTLVLKRVSGLAPDGAILSSRKNYMAFSDVGTAEDFSDANNNLAYDGNECFTDSNGNGIWDDDRAQPGLGGADDVVVYTASLTYRLIIPMGGLIDWAETNTITASTVLRNQPFGSQASRPERQICPA